MRDDQEQRRPAPHRPPDPETVWLDIDTARGVDAAGNEILSVLGGRRTKHATLSDLLTTALHHNARRLIVCGNIPDQPQSWLLPDTPAHTREFNQDWHVRGLFMLSRRPARGRFTHKETDRNLDILVADEWFPGQTLTPIQARWAWRELTHIIATRIDRDWALMDRPGAEGINLWKLRTPESYRMEPMDPELGALIQHTSPQHRYELCVDDGNPEDREKGWRPTVPAGPIPNFVYIDGRFMYAGSVTGEIGAAPATLLSATEARDLFTNNPWHPARYHIRFTVPSWWDDIGLLPVKRTKGRAGWFWPNVPGTTHETWVDTAELKLAIDEGWDTEAGPDGPITQPIEFLEGIKLTKVDPIRGWVKTIQDMIDIAEKRWADKTPTATTILTSALKNMLRVTIGQMSASNPVTTTVVYDADDIPSDIEGFDVIRNKTGDTIAYQYQTARHRPDPDTWHPEIAARIWALSRVRTLNTPIADPTTRKNATTKGGALRMNSRTLLAIHGDAIYTSNVPPWALPVAQGGGDDGKDGRLRVKGVLPGPLEAPQTGSERAALSEQAEQVGLPEEATSD
ncbi:hypothetical protein VO62_06175 [Cutibacterium acnes]|nr:hypothetical protein VO62_06175 [Cutibacterium acnes]